jgi:Restriction endonuclease AspBHI N-terminal
MFVSDALRTNRTGPITSMSRRADSPTTVTIAALAISFTTRQRAATVSCNRYSTTSTAANVPRSLPSASSRPLATAATSAFRGLAAPGAPSLQALDDLVAIWKTANGSRFQNYRATFTVLNADHVGREWISDILTGQPLSKNAPSAWWQFVSSGAYNVLAAPRALAYRKPSQQKPVTATGVQIIEAIHQHFQNRPYDFEKCAVSWRG